MFNSRKKVIAEIAMMEKQLNEHQLRMIEHKHYLIRLMGGTNVILFATLLPAFMVGWRVARKKHGKSAIKRLIKFGLLATLTHLKKTSIAII